MNLKRAQNRINEFYSYEKDLVFRFCVKDLIFIYHVREKSLDFVTILMPGNKLLLICIDDLNRLAFCENEAYLEHIEILIRLA